MCQKLILFQIQFIGLAVAYFSLELDTVKITGKFDIYYFERNISQYSGPQLRDQRYQEKDKIIQEDLQREVIEPLRDFISFDNITNEVGIKQILQEVQNQSINSQQSLNNSSLEQNDTLQLDSQTIQYDSNEKNNISSNQTQLTQNSIDQLNFIKEDSEDIQDENDNQSSMIQESQTQSSNDVEDITQNFTEQRETIVPLDNYYNYQYIGQINVLDAEGSIKKYRVIFDSGSSWIWLPRRNCDGCPSNKDTGLLCLSESKYCSLSSQNMNITYSIGAINGSIAQGYFAFDEIIDQFKQVKFLLVDYAWGMEGSLFQGIIGLELDNNEDSLISWPVGFYLNYGDDSITKEKSQISFGGINQNLILHNENMKFIPVNSHWIMDVQEFQIIYTTMTKNSISSQDTLLSYNLKEAEYITLNSSLQVVIDSGSSLLMLPKTQLVDLHQSFKNHDIECQIPEQSHTSLKCFCPTQDKGIFPTLSLTFKNGVSVTLEPKYYVHTIVDSHVCYVLISPIATHDDNLIIMGNPFMRKYYTLFDKENRQIGLAQSINTIRTKQILNITSIFSFFFVIGCSLTTAYFLITILNHLTKYYLKKKEVGKSPPPQQRMNYRLV